VARRRGRAAIAALAAIALIAVSCGDDDDDSGAETGSGSEAPADQGGDQSGGAGEESVTDYVAYVGGEAGPADDSLEPIYIGWLNQEGGRGVGPGEATIGLRPRIDERANKRGDQSPPSSPLTLPCASG
jgi:branched-chain amino acid transport system substrate-binding protein